MKSEILSYLESNGRNTAAEIRKALGKTSRAEVHTHLKELMATGAIISVMVFGRTNYEISEAKKEMENAILSVVGDAGSATTPGIVKKTGLPIGAVRQLLRNLENSGVVSGFRDGRQTIVYSMGGAAPFGMSNLRWKFETLLKSVR